MKEKSVKLASWKTSKNCFVIRYGYRGYYYDIKFNKKTTKQDAAIEHNKQRNKIDELINRNSEVK